MSREQIEEMACIMCGNNTICRGEGVDKCILYPKMQKYAKRAYNAGYRKQVEGEWIWTENGTEDYEQYWLCSCCNNKSYWKSKFCEECGAKMKGETQ